MWQGWSKDFFGFDIFDFGTFISRSKVRKDARGIVESWALESGIQLKEPGRPRTIGIPNISSPDKESEIQDPRRRIQNPWPSWITLRGAILLACVVRLRERFPRAKRDARELVSFRLSRKHCIRMLVVILKLEVVCIIPKSFRAEMKSYSVQYQQKRHITRRTGTSCTHTQKPASNCTRWSGWLITFQFVALNRNPNSWVFTSISVRFSPHPCWLVLPLRSDYVFDVWRSMTFKIGSGQLCSIRPPLKKWRRNHLS